MPPRLEEPDMDEVAIIGVGLHPFGRFGDKSAFEMGADAIELALDDAGVEWTDVQRAFGGSWEVAQADPLTGLVGLTGIPFMNVFNACATGAAIMQQAANAIVAGSADLVVAVGMDKHPRGSFKVDPTFTNVPAWYGDNGQFVTTKFFGMKINRYMHDHGITPETLAKVAAKNYRNGVLNPKAFRRKAISEDEILASPVLNHPLTAYMFCAPDEGAAALVMCRADQASRYTDTPIFVKAAEIRTRNYGAYEVNTSWAAVDEDVSPTVYASRAAYEQAGIGPEDVDVIQLQDTDAGAEVIHMAENGFCADGDQEKLVAEGATEINGPMPVNTDGGLIANGEPIGASGLRQVHELVLQLRGQGGERQVPGSPRVGYAQVYGAPGTAAATILSR
jgi:acetyl-CoA acetyltransferase